MKPSTKLALLGGGTLLFLLLRKSSEASSVPSSVDTTPSCSNTKPPTTPPATPKGYRRLKTVSADVIEAAHVAFKFTKNVGDTFVHENFPNLLFQSEWHCTPGRGWHRGVTAYERIG